MANHLEHAEHIAHAGHGHGDGHEPQGGNMLGTYIGITMAVLGVLLAFCAAKVGAERTELIQALVEQQHAHAKYQAQDIKHRVAVNNLRQIHSQIPAAEIGERLDQDLKKVDDEAAAQAASAPKGAEGAAAPAGAITKAARAVGRSVTAGQTPNREDAALLADTVDRYYHEAQAASAWVESFNPAIHAHVEAQERYELAQLLAEIGIVIASVALLVKRRIAWFAALGLGIASISYIGTTYAHTGHAVHAAEAKIEETGKEYRELRNHGKTTDSDQALVEEVRKWAGKSAPAPHAVPAHVPAKDGHDAHH